MATATMRNGFSDRVHHYVASKGAIAAVTRSLAKELGPYGIRVNTLVPGLVMNKSFAAGLAGKPGMREAVLAARGIKEDLFAEQLLGTLIYLASPDSDAVTGQYHIVDNGQDFT
jgi:NAD(P)-dependent dehydrogenase (short-subunit alcohol dehydrogenase family)